MGIRNFRIYFLPVEEVIAVCGAIPDSLALDTFESHQWWSKEDFSRVVSCLDELFGMSHEKYEGMLTWQVGPHCINVCHENKELVEELGVKVDVTQPSEPFLRNVVEAARQLNCIFHFVSLGIARADFEQLYEAFRKSLAVQFFENAVDALSDPDRPELQRVPGKLKPGGLESEKSG
jgi:hypothetical protein